jgi:hypothetical protein
MPDKPGGLLRRRDDLSNDRRHRELHAELRIDDTAA